MKNNIEIIHALRSAAEEIKSLRRQIVSVKAEAYDVHSEVIKRLFGGSQVFGVCSAHQAEKLAAELEGQIRPQPPCPPGMNHFCRGESGSGEWSCRSEEVPSICHYCGEANEALLKQGLQQPPMDNVHVAPGCEQFPEQNAGADLPRSGG